MEVDSELDCRRRQMHFIPVPRPSKNSPTLLSAFSGLGGLDLGFKRAGFRIVGSIEFDPIARASLLANWPRHRLIQPHDVTLVAKKLKPVDVGLRRKELDVLAGGPPCQPFSKAAQWSHKAMRGMRDPRAKCLTGFIQLIERFLPKAVVIENVQGFATGKRNGVSRLQQGLRKINRVSGTKYQLMKQIVDASDYGVPQRRSRAILVALRDGAEFSFPETTTVNKPVVY